LVIHCPSIGEIRHLIAKMGDYRQALAGMIIFDAPNRRL
jgi:hypothetical protein